MKFCSAKKLCAEMCHKFSPAFLINNQSLENALQPSRSHGGVFDTENSVVRTDL